MEFKEIVITIYSHELETKNYWSYYLSLVPYDFEQKKTNMDM